MKIIISVSTNVLNPEDIDLRFLLTGVSNIDTWINKTLKNYYLNTKSLLRKVTKLPKNAPNWAVKALSEGELYEFDSSKRELQPFTLDIEHAIGWLKTFPETKVLNVSVEEAIRQGNLLIDKQNKKASSEEGEVKTLYTFKDGYRIVSCLDPTSLKREGKIMQHCVGSEEQNYIKKVSMGTLEIWSLRDTINEPHCTIEYDVKNKKIQQIKGKQNNGVVGKYHKYIKEWLILSEKTGLIEDFDASDMMNVGVLYQEGIWYDVLHLPDGFIIKGDLLLDNSEISYLPINLTVGGSLELTNCKKLKMLPEGLRVKGSIDLSGCKNLVNIPNSLSKIKGDLILIGCTNLTDLPNDMLVGGSFEAPGCNSLKRLPKTLRVSTTLDLSDCTNLSEMPDDLDVLEYLYLYNCTSLTTLSKKLYVGKNLDITRCFNLTSLPNNIIVGQFVNLPKNEDKPGVSLAEAKRYFSKLNKSASPDYVEFPK